MNSKTICIGLLTFYLLLNACYGQGRTLLLYAKDETFLPIIEQILSQMKDYRTEEFIFNKIINLNTWSVNKEETVKLDSLIKFYESDPQLRKNKEYVKEFNDSLAISIRNADCYIRINVLSKLPIIEFQLIITDSLPDFQPDEYSVLITNKSRYEGFIINITQSDYLMQFNNSVKKLFPFNNRPPILNISKNSLRHEDSLYYFIRGRTAVLDASESYDVDSPRESLIFQWRQLNPNYAHEKKGISELIPIDPFAAIQNIIFSHKGAYRFGISINDGINSSDEKFMLIKVIDPPTLDIQNYYKISPYIFQRRGFSIPIKISNPEPDNTTLKMLPIDFKYKSLLGNNLSHGNAEISLDSLSKNSYQINVQNAMDIGEYVFKLYAHSDKASSDTFQIKVDYKPRFLYFRPNIVAARQYFSMVDPQGAVYLSPARLIINFRPSVSIYFNKIFYFDVGFMIPLYQEYAKIFQNDFFYNPSYYMSFNLWSMRLSIYFSHFSLKTTGFGSGINWGAIFKNIPISMEVSFSPLCKIKGYEEYTTRFANFSIATDFGIPIRSDVESTILGYIILCAFFYLNVNSFLY
ncbi:MAG: hypothetical protein JXC36_07540 [Candidatus Atribacteria bacterium]|nr:hypothetical protein [Candidatus Atribacteria bacterium]